VPKLLIRHAVILTMQNRSTIRDGHVLVEDGIVSSVGDDCDAPAGSSDDVVIDAEGSVVLPGLIDAHAHVSEYILRDLVDEDVDAKYVEESTLRPFYRRLTPDLEEMTAGYFFTESLRCGVTTVATAALDPLAVARAARRIGIRIAVGPALDSTEGSRAPDAMESLAREAERSPGWVLPLVALSSLDGKLEEAAANVSRWGARLFAHMGGRRGELTALVEAGIDPSKSILAYNPASPAEELAAAAARGLGLAVCPVTLMYFGGGLGRSPLPELSRIGAKVALGSGGIAGIPVTDMLRTAGTMALALRDSRLGRSAADAWWALSSVTSSAADALGASNLGRIRAGALGDIVILDPRLGGGRPIGGNPQEYAVYRGSCRAVRTVIVNGRIAWDSPLSDSPHPRRA
jgi:5-methylthioadenosine/S-adenosylhomocysteine deaminase